jgi:hypothetical protein
VPFPNNPGGPPLAGGPPLGGLLGGAVDPAETQRRLTGRLAGTWRADLGGGVTQQVTYKQDGTYTDVLAGPRARSLEGTWKVAGLIGSKGLKLDRTGGGSTQVRVVFEDDELLHDTDTPGVTGVFRRI